MSGKEMFLRSALTAFEGGSFMIGSFQRGCVLGATLGLFLLLSPAVQAQTSAEHDRAYRLLNNWQHASDRLSVLIQTGGKLKKLDLSDPMQVNQPFGASFCIRCTYTWESAFGGDATSTLNYYFDGNGKIVAFNDATTSAFANFAVAGAVFDALKTELQKNVNDIQDPQARQILQTALQSSNIRLLYLGMMRVRQELNP
jgi:hypothetical protein